MRRKIRMNNKKKLRLMLLTIGIILQSIAIITYYFNQTILAMLCFIIALLFIVSSIFIMDAAEARSIKIELDDERNTMIRNMAHAKTNTLMICIQALISITCLLLNHFVLSIFFACLILLNTLILNINYTKIEKQL